MHNPQPCCINLASLTANGVSTRLQFVQLQDKNRAPPPNKEHSWVSNLLQDPNFINNKCRDQVIIVTIKGSRTFTFGLIHI